MNIVQNVKNNRKFYSTIGSLNLGALCVGLAMGWPRPYFTYLYERIGSATFSYRDEAWTESAINIGASLGSLASIFITDIYGRRISFALSASILLVFWIFLATSGIDKTLIISAASVAGLGCGVFTVTTVLYVAEISLAENRGSVGASAILFGYFGIFAMNLFGYFLDITILLSLMPILPMFFMVAIYFWMIESPFYLFQMGMVLDAKLSLKNLRDCKRVLEVDDEYNSMLSFFNSTYCKKPRQLMIEALCSKSLRPTALIVLPLLSISQILGVIAISDYAESLIESIYPSIGKLVTSFIDVISTVLCLFAIERFGRRLLIAFTILGSGLCCLFLATYNLMDERQCSTQTLLTDHRILPVSVLCLYYAIYALGLTPVLPIVTGEIFPCRAKTAAVGICSGLLYFVTFFAQQAYKALYRYTSSCLAFAYFTVLGSVSLPFVIALMPETKRKSLFQIQNELENFVVMN